MTLRMFAANPFYIILRGLTELYKEVTEEHCLCYNMVYWSGFTFIGTSMQITKILGITKLSLFTTNEISFATKDKCIFLNFISLKK